MNKKYIVRLTDEERATCEATIAKETGKSQKLRRATILLKADADGPGWTDSKIREAVGCRTRTVENVRQAFVLDGFEATLARKPPSPRPPRSGWTGRARRNSMPCGWASHPPASAVGRSACWPTNWWSWRWWTRSARRRSTRR